MKRLFVGISLTLIIFIVKCSSAQDENEFAIPLLDKSFFEVFGVEENENEKKETTKINVDEPSHHINPWLRGLRKTLKKYGNLKNKLEAQDSETGIVAERLIADRRSAQSIIPSIFPFTTATPTLIPPTNFEDLLSKPKISKPIDLVRANMRAVRKETKAKKKKFKATTPRPPTPMDLAREQIKATLAPSRKPFLQEEDVISTTGRPFITTTREKVEEMTFSTVSPSLMDRARDIIKKGRLPKSQNLQSPSPQPMTTTTMEPTTESAMAIARKKIKDELTEEITDPFDDFMNSDVSPTTTSTPGALEEEILLETTTLSPLAQLQMARDKLRILMGQKPKQPQGTTFKPHLQSRSSPAMSDAKLKIMDMIKKKSNTMKDPIFVNVRGNSGDVRRPKEFAQPPPALTFEPVIESTTEAFDYTTLPPHNPTRQELLELIESSTQSQFEKDQPVLGLGLVKGEETLVESEGNFLHVSGNPPPSQESRDETEGSVVISEIGNSLENNGNKNPLDRKEKLQKGHIGFVKPRRTFSDFKPPSRRQNILLRRLRPAYNGRVEGLEPPRIAFQRKKNRGKPFERLIKNEPPNGNTADRGIVTSRVKTGKPTNEGDKMNPLLGKLQAGNTGKFFQPEVPSIKQDTLLRQLQPGHTGVNHPVQVPSLRQDTLLKSLISGQTGANHRLAIPSIKQDTLLRQLQSGHTGADHELEAPSVKQDTLLRQLQSGHTGANHGLEVPSVKQDTLLRQLQSGHTGADHGLEVPSTKQDTLLRALQEGQTGAHHPLKVPSIKQDTLLASLIPGDTGAVADLLVPSLKQDTLLRPLQSKHRFENLRLRVPSFKQDPLLGPLKPAQTGSDHDLQIPSVKQDTLLKPLQSGHTGSNHLLTVPTLKQDTLLGQLQAGRTSADLHLEVPSVKQDPFLKKLNPTQENTPNFLMPPPTKEEEIPSTLRQNPLLRILRLDRRARLSGNGVDLSRLPIFKQLINSPQRFRQNFEQLPKRMKANLIRIIQENGNEDFDFSSLGHNSDIGVDATPTTAAPNLIGSTFADVFPTAFGPKTLSEVQLSTDKDDEVKENVESLPLTLHATSTLQNANSEITTNAYFMHEQESTTSTTTKSPVSSTEHFDDSNRMKPFRGSSAMLARLKINSANADELRNEDTVDQSPLQGENSQQGFKEDMKEVIDMLKTDAKILSQEERTIVFNNLMEEAIKKSTTSQERRENVEMVNSLMRMSMRNKEDGSTLSIPKQRKEGQMDSSLMGQNSVSKNNLNEEPSVKITFGPAPRPTHSFSPVPTTAMPTTGTTTLENFQEILRETQNQTILEDKIVDMIIDDPDTVVETVSNILQNVNKKEPSRTEVLKAIETDPLGMTVALSDMMIQRGGMNKKVPKKKLNQKARKQQGKIAPTPDIDGQQQFMRLRSPKNMKSKMRLPQLKSNENLSDKVWNSMLVLIDEGKLSRKQIVEQLINMGLLPVKVTEMGRVPIIVGERENEQRFNVPEPSEPLRISPGISHIMSMEMPRVIESAPQPLRIKETQPPMPTTMQPKKAIDAKTSMINLFNQGLIDKNEFKEIMGIFEGRDVNIEPGFAKQPSPPYNFNFNRSHFEVRMPKNRPQNYIKMNIHGSKFETVNPPREDIMEKPPQTILKRPNPPPVSFGESYVSFEMGEPKQPYGEFEKQFHHEGREVQSVHEVAREITNEQLHTDERNVGNIYQDFDVPRLRKPFQHRTSAESYAIDNGQVNEPLYLRVPYHSSPPSYPQHIHPEKLTLDPFAPSGIFDIHKLSFNSPQPPFAPPSNLARTFASDLYSGNNSPWRRQDKLEEPTIRKVQSSNYQTMPFLFPLTGHLEVDGNIQKIRQSFLLNERRAFSS